MKPMSEKLQQRLDQRKMRNSFRELNAPRDLVDFFSNDYLGFSGSRSIYEQAISLVTDGHSGYNGASGSRLLSGNHPLLIEAEEVVARHYRAKEALLFNSGYDANTGILGCIPQKEDFVIYDELVHASIREGLLISKAISFKFRHNDLSDLEQKINRVRQRDSFTSNSVIYVVTESVFSMDGDSPDLKAVCELCSAYHCELIVDEAHAVGVLGNRGEGLMEFLGLSDHCAMRIVTFGKALGVQGAAVLCSRQIKAYLTNFARSLIYTTAMPPHSAATIIIAHDELNKGAAHRELGNKIQFFKNEITRLGIADLFVYSNAAIQCMIIGGNDNVKAMSKSLEEDGFEVKPILAPTVPAGSERLRVCVHSFNTNKQITDLLIKLKKHRNNKNDVA